MATKVLVPLLGEGVEEVTVTRWLKKEGEVVREFEALLEVNTDKVDTEVPAPVAGTVLKILAQEGVPARVGEVLAFIGQPGESLPDEFLATPASLRVSSAAAEPAARTTPAPGGGLGFISPVVARLAAEHGVDLGRIPGTGMHGRITKHDVLRFLEAGTPSPAAGGAPAPASEHALGQHEVAELREHTLMRRQIAEHMLHSQRTSPHVLTVMEADLSRVLAHRSAHKGPLEAQGVNLTLTAYFLMAIATGLGSNPLANASWTEEGILIHRDINLGVATSLGADGLIVPVIKNAGSMNLAAMARAVNDLASRARARQLQPDDVRGGTFTLTNHGISGSLFALPIINQPQCGILGTGALQRRAVVVGDAIAIRPMVYLSFVFDHRILDGASADTFLAKVKETLQQWD